ncbi:MAG: inositol monophosphatase family protein [Eubacteriales bacterium]|nr:inositol monophosphatase family protein [Eubacteriales bacterium]
MLNKTEQTQVISLIKKTRELIYREMRAARVTIKGAADYVTNVDFAVQDFMKRELELRFPDIRMIAEEKENKDLYSNARYWILDPIDGTTNLIHHYGLSAVSLALYEQGEITFGAVYNPFHEEFFYAAKGQGAYLNDRQIFVDENVKFSDAVVSYGSSPYDKSRAKKLFPLYYRIFMKAADFRRTGSAALDLCYVACGRQHAYFEQDLKPWDYAAGSLILTEAGGAARGWDGGKLPFLTNADIAASTKTLAEPLMDMLCEK